MAIRKLRCAGPRFGLRPLRARAARPRREGAAWHWFDHPEMQARIARAEADRAAGRVQRADSLEELLAQLRAIE